MNKLWLAAIIPAAIAAGVAVAVVTLLVVKLLWAWTVPDLFPKAVQEGYVAAQISWLTAFKIALVVGIISGMARGASHTDNRPGRSSQ